MGKDLIRKQKTRAFIARRLKAYEKVKSDYPEGITKENLEKFKKSVKAEEKRLKKEE